MSWRTIYISSQCHLSYKNGYLVVRGEETQSVHLSEIHSVIIDNNASSVSTYLLNELVQNKIKVIICNDKHNPSFELIPYHSAYNSSQIISKEMLFTQENAKEVWKEIIKAKIGYQANVLKKYKLQDWELVDSYKNDVELGDITNREGFAAKVYFNRLFGNGFFRDDDNDTTNSFLNYGYIVLLSMFNREIINAGYITQIGIHHIGVTNPFNLSCDLMEPFRPIVDQFAYEHRNVELDKKTKLELIEYLNKKINYGDKSVYLSHAIRNYVNNVLKGLSNGECQSEWFEYREE